MGNDVTLTLEQLNGCAPTAFVDHLHGIYEHSPWIPARAATRRPFASVTALKLALADVVGAAGEDEQLGLIRAHPELAGKAAVADLTLSSRDEQAGAGLHLCSAGEFATLRRLNAEYNARFGFPFILAVKGPDGQGLTRGAIISTFARRLRQQRREEIAECLRQINRIAELRLNALLDVALAFGPGILARADQLARWSEHPDHLTCAYLSEAHVATAHQLADWMRAAGMEASIDTLGNVVGRYASPAAHARTLVTGSHYDTVRNGGKYDGRLGILAAIAVVAQLRDSGRHLPFHLEVIAFSEEEGVRFKSTFLGSSAVAGRFDTALLSQTDVDGIAMGAAIAASPHAAADGAALEENIAALAREPMSLLGYVEVHIEQGPVLLERDLPLGVVTAIAGSSRFLVELTGLAGHAGTTPMTMRRDAAAAAAEIVLMVEDRCGQAEGLVGTVGQLNVPNGSVNVIPGACTLSLDIRAADDATRLAAVDDVLSAIGQICAARRIDADVRQIVDAAAAPCAPWLMDQLGACVERAGLPRFDLPSGAGHDAMALAAVTDVAMLFVRCGNGGISHHPLETMTADDADIAARVLLDFFLNFKTGA